MFLYKYVSSHRDSSHRDTWAVPQEPVPMAIETELSPNFNYKVVNYRVWENLRESLILIRQLSSAFR